MLSRQKQSEPHVNWHHIDGPMMVCRDGSIKWLTYRERFMFWIGLWSLRDIEARPYAFNAFEW